MNKKWQLMGALLGLSLIVFFSCQNDKDEPLDNKGSVSFNVSALTVPTDDNPGGRTAVEPGTCDMKFASYVVVEVDGNPHRLDIEEWSGDFKTDLLELDPGVHVLSQFVVFDADGNAIFATPSIESEFEKFVQIPLPVEFEVLPYEKIENYIEVLCIEDFTPPEFGFKFWDFEIMQVKYLCIFANYCEEEYGHLVANLEVEVYPSAEQTDPDDLIWSGASQGPGDLLCMKLPYDPRIPTEEQFYYIILRVNGIIYVADINLAFVDDINESEKGYLHLNENCHGDIRPFSRIAQLAWEDLVTGGNDQDYNDIVVGVEISGDGDNLFFNLLPMARGAGYEHRFELVFQADEVAGVNSPYYIRDDGATKAVVVCDETSCMFGESFVNVSCGGATSSYAVKGVVIDVTDDFVFHFDRPLKPCLHTIAGETVTYNLFLYDWNGDGQSTYTLGDAEFPNGLVINKDWTRGNIWKWPIETESILDAYPEFGPIPVPDGWYNGAIDPAYVYPDGCGI